MSRLRTNRWRTQKVGVSILCSLAKTCVCSITLSYTNPFDHYTGFGAEVLKQVMPEIVDMLLPTHDSHPPYTSQSKPPSALLGPALVMRVLAENGELATVCQSHTRIDRVTQKHCEKRFAEQGNSEDYNTSIYLGIS